jgi:VIT1/CCC1 family predicted Fe2+/Mn2+ transporter
VSATADLASEHEPAAIRARLSHPPPESVAGDVMLGAVDGLITTFAVVAGSSGGNLSTAAILILGLANLIADGFSMAASNFLGTRARQQAAAKARAEEISQIERYPEGERRELYEIYARKGLAPDTLRRVVEQITADREVWVETMMAEELKISAAVVRPFRAALATFAAFTTLGLLPLLPYLLAFPGHRLLVSGALALLGFLCVGAGKGWALKQDPLRSAFITASLGTLAGALAYVTGAGVQAAALVTGL